MNQRWRQIALWILPMMVGMDCSNSRKRLHFDRVFHGLLIKSGAISYTCLDKKKTYSYMNVTTVI